MRVKGRNGGSEILQGCLAVDKYAAPYVRLRECFHSELGHDSLENIVNTNLLSLRALTHKVVEPALQAEHKLGIRVFRDDYDIACWGDEFVASNRVKP